MAVALVAAAAAASAAPATKAKAKASKPAAAHVPVKKPAPSPDVYAGYSYTQAGEASLHGWALAGTYPLGEGGWRGVLELTGHYGPYALADLSQTGVFGGARRVFQWRGVRPFAEGLLGLARTSISASGVSDGDTDWGVALGAGVDVPVSGRWSARGLVQLRLLRGEGSTDSDTRLSAGVVYRLGR